MSDQLEKLVGNKFSVITQDSVRYEGTLKDLDLKTSFIILENVKVHGTEDREGKRFVPPEELVLPVHSFHSSNIQSINMVGSGV
jgi:small nuclear ribonucleoprotein (snRNP)-like protein